MYTTLLSTVLLAAFGFLISPGKKLSDVLAFSFLFSVIGLITGILTYLLLGLWLTDKSDFKRIETKRELVSLQSSVGPEGNLFLGTGNVGRKKRYYYFIETERGKISRSVAANRTYVNEGTASPSITKTRFKQKESNGWYFPNVSTVGVEPYNKIFIPEGSIKTNYDL